MEFLCCVSVFLFPSFFCRFVLFPRLLSVCILSLSCSLAFAIFLSLTLYDMNYTFFHINFENMNNLQQRLLSICSLFTTTTANSSSSNNAATTTTKHPHRVKQLKWIRFHGIAKLTTTIIIMKRAQLKIVHNRMEYLSSTKLWQMEIIVWCVKTWWSTFIFCIWFIWIHRTVDCWYVCLCLRLCMLVVSVRYVHSAAAAAASIAFSAG